MDFPLLWAERIPTNILSSECRFAVDGGDKCGRKFFRPTCREKEENS